jgi:RNA polymerase sigma-70 factor (ECF subfamily)
MSEHPSFADFIRRIRAGDAAAAEELVRQYESVIRVAVRLRLGDRRLRRLFDSLDICQAVLASFFVRTAAGQYQLDQPDDLVRLLVGMAHNKLVKAIRKQQAQRRDYRAQKEVEPEEIDGAARGPSPSQVLANEELLRECRQRLTEEERQLADFRGEGLPWADIAARLGGTAQARRKQLERALDRVAGELGLEEASDE